MKNVKYFICEEWSNQSSMKILKKIETKINMYMYFSHYDMCVEMSLSFISSEEALAC